MIRRLRLPRRRRTRWLVFALSIVGIWLAVSLVVAIKLTSRARPPFDEPPPAVTWGHFESQRLKTPDGETLGAWSIDGSDDRPAVILLHGNGGSRRQCVHIAEFLKGLRCPSLLVSLRAHGDSSGRFNDIGYSARHDVVAAVEFLERRRPGRPIVILGTSLGAAAASFASGELGSRVSGYILECPYRDLKTAVRNRTENELPRPLDSLAYLGLRIVAPLVLPDLNRISVERAVSGVPGGVPILILAGEDDRRARPEEARAIFARVKSHARLVMFEKAGHLKLHETDSKRYRDEVVRFLSGLNERRPR